MFFSNHPPVALGGFEAVIFGHPRSGFLPLLRPSDFSFAMVENAGTGDFAPGVSVLSVQPHGGDVMDGKSLELSCREHAVCPLQGTCDLSAGMLGMGMFPDLRDLAMTICP